jgi:diguanylate cyclase (GGDEF)-like protein
MNLPHISYDSLVLMTIVNLLTTGLVMLFIWNADRPGPGLNEIALGSILIGCGLLIAGLRNIFPLESVIPLSNFSVFAGALLKLNGVRLFRGFGPLPPWFNVAASLVYATPFLYFTFVHDNMAARVLVSSLGLCVIVVMSCVSVLIDLPREDRRLYFFSATLLGFHAFSLAVRVCWAATHRMEGAYQTGSPADFTAFFTMNFAITGCCLAIATASSRKLYHSTRKLALHDPLTKLPNRRMFEDRMAELCSSGTRANIALIYIDLDNFKFINETFGHAGGDHVLQVVGERLMNRFVGACLPARVGGDEFVILLESVQSRADAFNVLEKVIEAVQAEVTMGHKNVRLEASSGLALFPEDVTCLADLTDMADRRMYRAKRAPRPFAPFAGQISEARLKTSPKSLA